MRYTHCLSCRLPHDPDDRQHRPVRHGLCPTCYHRAVTLGLVQRYPACGAVPVPYRTVNTYTCIKCGTPVRNQSRWCRPCYRQHRNPPPPAMISPCPILRDYPAQPAIVGAPQQAAWQACVAWESRPQRWSTLRPAERRSA